MEILLVLICPFELFWLESKVWVKENKKRSKIGYWLVKNQKILSNPDETWWKWLAHDDIIFTKFHEDW